ncbi:type I polyketide synthase [Actinomyces qiguomingii]|uniref:type I polyketide synthase n=1 Tax=Actinomyces qiguomingii TaxID=2057800 RepID=UPI000CA07F99|nr:type I polyketide synthase [Actinomyces qiguomingii]
MLSISYLKTTEGVVKVSAQSVAIVGMACRFPGAQTVSDFWANIRGGVDSISEVPADRWNATSFFSSRGVRGRSRTKWGGFISDVTSFDAEFFGISPREAETLDPQQRLLLEVAYEALEDASLTEDILGGLRVGVFVGGFTLEYMMMQLGGSEYSGVTPHTATGSMMTLLANRLSYVYNFRGPSVTVDTACSSSLTATHMAVTSLERGECDIAVVGGVNAIMSPAYMVAESRAGMLSPTGTSHPFDGSANGYVRGEGAGVVVLMPGDGVDPGRQSCYATIVASGVNQDGASEGITVPNGDAQSDLTRLTLARAGLSSNEIAFVEAHGTGTPVGDPIEANSLGRVLGEGRKSPCYIGSVKANIGHLEAAAGVAGLIKAVLELHHGEIVPQLHVNQVNSAIDLEALNLAIPTGVVPLGPHDRYALVNSFGFGGANAQVILRRSDEESGERGVEGGGAVLLALSARSPEALEARAHQIADYIEESGRSVHEVAAQLVVARDHHPMRCSVSASSAERVVELLRTVGADDAIRSDPSSRLAFVYSGMGPQWNGMGAELYASEEVFRRTIETIASYASESLPWRLTDAFTGGLDERMMAQTIYAQPAGFALQVGLTALLASWGIKPAVVCGHSAGEPAAAYAAGALSLQEATLVSVTRSVTQQTAAGQGRLLAVGCSHERARELMAAWRQDHDLETAAVNSPASCALVGPEDQLRDLGAHLDRAEVFNRMVPGEVPYHSSRMEPLEAEIRLRLKDLSPRLTRIPMVSTVTGAVVDGSELDAGYWYANVRRTVQFNEAVGTLVDLGADVFLEVTPHPALTRSLIESTEDRKKDCRDRTVATLRRGESDIEYLLSAVGRLYCCGVRVSWQEMYRGASVAGRLPCYPWRRQAYWQESEASARRVASRPHPFIAHGDDGGTQVWDVDLFTDDLAWLDDHRIEDEVVFPAAGYVELAMWAAERVYGRLSRLTFHDVSFERALYLDPEAPAPVRLRFDRDSGRFSVSSRRQNDWQQHATGRVVLSSPATSAYVDAPPIDDAETLDSASAYEELLDLGLNYGRSFRALTTVRRGEGRATGYAALPGDLVDGLRAFCCHPVLIDIAFQTLALASHTVATDRTFMPVAVSQGGLAHELPAEVIVHATVSEGTDEEEIRGDVVLTDQEGRVLMQISGCRARDVSASGAPHPVEYVGVEWKEVEPEGGDPGSEPDGFAVMGSSVLAVEIESELRSRGKRVVRVADPHAAGWSSGDGMSDAVGAVIDLRALDGSPLCAPARAAELGVGSLHLFQAQANGSGTRMPRIWTITRLAQSVAEARIDPTGAVLWGLGRAVGQFEMPGLHGGIIDVDDTAGNAVRVVEEVLGGRGEDQVALRRGRRWVPRMVPTVLRPVVLPPLREDAAYLISGGLGALGLVTARWLVEHGARHLVLVGRSVLPDRDQWAILDDQRMRTVMDLERAGVDVELVGCDVADGCAVENLLRERRDAGRPEIKGVIHAAGTSVPRLVVDMTEADFREILRPKVDGAWNLDRAFKTGLDFFVMYSSVASLIVSPGQANYAAGNAFMDSLAYARRSRGEHGLSMNWGPWGDVGMATQLDLMEFFDRRGLHPNTSVQGTEALECALANDLVQVAPIAPDWKRTISTYPGGSAPAMLRHYEAADSQAEQIGGESMREAIAAAPPHEREQRIREGVADLVANVLRYDRDRMRYDAPLTSLGMDSMLGIEIKARIETALGVDVSIVSLLKGMTLNGLTESVATKMDLWSDETIDPEVEALLAETADGDPGMMKGVDDE